MLPLKNEKDRSTVIEHSLHLVWLKLGFTNSTQIYNYIAHNQSSYSCPWYVYEVEVYNKCV